MKAKTTAYLFLSCLLCSGCASLTKSQLSEVNAFGQLSCHFSAYPGTIIATCDEVHRQSELFKANSEPLPKNHQDAVDEALAFKEITGLITPKIDLSFKIIDQYGQALVLLTSDKHSKALDTVTKSLGTNLNGLIVQYNKADNANQLKTGIGSEEGGVQVIFSYQYVPEEGLGEMHKIAWLYKLLDGLGVKYAERFEQRGETTEVFTKTMNGINAMETQVMNAPPVFNAVIPKNLADFETALAAGQTIIIHSLEGGHHLGRNLANTQAYLDNLAVLKAAGTCVLTLSNFFVNDLCDSSGGIPPSEAGFFGYSAVPGNPPGLTSTGQAVVEWCQDNGIIIDLVHASEATRNSVYAILDARLADGKSIRPLIFSHTGLRIMVDPYMLSDSDHLVLPSDDELDRIHRYGGTMGMILMNYWQNGDEQRKSLFVNSTGIANVIATMLHIKERTGDVSAISVGSDLDGFTTVPSDVPHVSYMDNLRQAILQNFSQEEADQICFGNALRVLRAGWS